MSRTDHEVTQLLAALQAGNRSAYAQLFPLVYHELHNLARSFMQQQRAGHTLQPTALVHETYLRLAGPANPTWKDRAHFLAVAARSMRHILINHERQRRTVKRSAYTQHVELKESTPTTPPSSIDIIALGEALDALKAIDEAKAAIVELRYFGGLDIAEIAEVLELSESSVKRHWNFAKGWLQRQLDAESAHESPAVGSD